MISVKDLKKDFGDYTALEGLTCNIERGSIYGLVGYNGSGKTTLLKTLSGIYKADAGKVLVDGENIYDNEQAKRRMFFVPDDLYFTFQANMKSMARFYKGYYPRWSDKTFNSLTEIFVLDKNKRINGFSKGMQRQAAIILALSTSPDYLLLDESFDGLDPVKRSLVKQLLTEVMAEKEMGIIISSHNLRELEDLCDRIGIINNKHIVNDCSLDELRASKNKYRLAFAVDISEELLLDIEYTNYSKSGKVITFISTGDSQVIKDKLDKLNPVLFEILPLTLEEIFLNEMGVQEYDFTGTF